MITYLLYDGDRLLTEVRARDPEDAKAHAVRNITAIVCSLRRGEAPYEYRQRVARSRAVPVLPYPAKTP